MKRTKSKPLHHRAERYTKLVLSPTESVIRDEAQNKSPFTSISSTIPNQSFSSPSQSPFSFMSPYYPSKSQSSSRPFVSSNVNISLNRVLPKPNLAAFVEPQLEHDSSFNSIHFQKTDPFSTPRSGRSSASTPSSMSMLSDQTRFTSLSPSSPALTESKLQFIEKSSFLARLVPSVSRHSQTASPERFASRSRFDEKSSSSSALVSPLSMSTTPRSAASAHLDHLSQHVFESKREIHDFEETSPASSFCHQVSQRRLAMKCDSWRGAIHIDETLFYNLTPSQAVLSPSQSVSSSNASVELSSHHHILAERDDIESSQQCKRQKLI